MDGVGYFVVYLSWGCPWLGGGRRAERAQRAISGSRPLFKGASDYGSCVGGWRLPDYVITTCIEGIDTPIPMGV